MNRSPREPSKRKAFAAETIRRIIRSYGSPVIRLYSLIRFTILRQPFLDEIGQYLPRNGHVLDLGCGFGLFSLYYSILEQDRYLTGVDLNSRRITRARESARKLNVGNVEYEACNAVDWVGSRQFDAIYMLDLIHHLPAAEVAPFITKVASLLRPGGILIIKDVAHRPYYKMLFTLILDRLMVGLEAIRYWPPEEVEELLEGLGFEVFKHRLNDILPYPHILYIARPNVERTEPGQSG